MSVLRAGNVVAYDGDIEITGTRPEDLSLKIDHIVIKVGRGDFEKKLERLEFVKDEIQKRNMQVATIDLRFANKIVVRPVSETAPSEEPAQPQVRKQKERNGKKKKK
jgi:cell division septal protein FtsQ